MDSMHLLTVASRKTASSIHNNAVFSLSDLLNGDPDWDNNQKDHSGFGRDFYYRSLRGEFDGNGYTIRPTTSKNPQRYQKNAAASDAAPFNQPSAIHPVPLTSIQTGFLGEINSVLALLGKTLAVIDIS